MNKQLRMQGNAYYQFINVNPKGKFCGDCVIRAIALACDQSWEQTIRELTELGIKKGYELNDKKLYPQYLKEKGFREVPEPRDVNNRKMSVRDWIVQYQVSDKYVYVMNVGLCHVSCVKNRKVHDTWDCSKNTAHKIWEKGVRR